ncbi:MAG TPA: hypothetical protein VF988_10330 [Verrucomicrobiae bacterium]
MKKYIILLLLALTGAVAVRAAEDTNAMTPARFLEIINAPADAVPLIAPMAAVPIWPKAVVTNVMTYASGKTFTEVLTNTAHTVQGKYAVFTTHSKYYKKAMAAVLGYDDKASALKSYGFYDDGHGGGQITEGTVVFDFAKKTYTINSTYGDFEETTTGTYTDTDDVAKTTVFKKGVRFMTRETTTHRL